MEPSVLSSRTFASDLLSGIKTDRYDRFLAHACSSTDVNYAVLTLPFECKDPLPWFDQHRASFSFQYYWEKPSHNRAMAALGQTKKLETERPKRFEKIGRALHKIRDQIHHYSAVNEVHQIRFLGGFSFFDQSTGGDPSATFTLPTFTLQTKQSTSSLSIALGVQPAMQKKELHQQIKRQLNRLSHKKKSPETWYEDTKKANPAPPKPLEVNGYKHWQRMIGKAQNLISNQALKKVVLARQLTVETSGRFSPTYSLHRLRTTYPRCQSFLIKREKEEAFVGSTPELLMEVKDGQLRTEALAGSIARGKDDAEDERLAQNLRASLKNNEEHQYVVDHVENLSRPFASELNYPDRPEIKRLSNVQHLYTPITATLKEEARPLELLQKLHPTPAVGGTPRDLALTFIKENEDFDRGWFAGPVGWITPEQDCHFSVAIRSGLIGKHQARLFAGCGIVAGSDADKEWEETKLKFEPMLSALNYE